MSDAAQPPHPPENVSAERASSEGAATGETASESPAGSASGAATDSGPEFDPWAPPAGHAQASGTTTDGFGTTLFWDDGDTTPPLPSVHHPTVPSTPAAATTTSPPTPQPGRPGHPGQYGRPGQSAPVTPPAPQPSQPSQPWANSFAPPGGPVAGTPQDNPLAPSAPYASYARPVAPGEPVPPPPIAPDGPGHAPYSYPGGPVYGYPQQQLSPAVAGAGYPAPPMYGGGPGYGWAPMAPQPSNGMGTAALVVGIVSAVFICFWPLAIILGVLAVIFGVIGRGKVRRGEATNGGQALAGIICGAVGIVIGAGFGFIVIAFGDDSDASTFDDGYSTVLSQRA